MHESDQQVFGFACIGVDREAVKQKGEKNSGQETLIPNARRAFSGMTDYFYFHSFYIRGDVNI